MKLTIIIHAVLAVVILMLIWPAIKGGSDGYNTKSVGVIVSKVTSEVEVEEVIEEVVEETTEPEMTEAVVETEVVDTATVEEKIEEVVAETVAPVAVETEVVEEKVEEASAAGGQVHVVTAEGLKYNPLVIQIQPGDTVAWENMSSHDTQSMEGLIPAGAEAWHSGMGENYQRTFTVEGIYVYKCTPHFGAGMGGVVIVGKPTNLAEVQAFKAKGATKRLVKKALAAAIKL